jgi:flagellin
MSVRINTNIEAVNAQRNLGVTANAFAKSVEKLSSGLRINRAADDAAGLAISEKLRAQERGLNQAVRNTQDAISLVQTAEGGMNEIHSILQRIRELAVEYNNGTQDTDSQAAITSEVSQLTQAVTDIVANTSFNGTDALMGSDYTFQVGANDGQTFAVSIDTVDASSLDGTSISAVDTLINDVSTYRATLGAAQNYLEHMAANLGVAAENITASESRIRDVDVAAEMVNFTKTQILQQAGTAILAQANSAPQSILTLLR